MKIEFYEQYGNYNMMDTSEYTTQWYITIKDSNRKTIQIDDVDCRLYFEEDGDQRGRYEMADGIEYLAEKSFEYARKTWSTKNYKQQTINFITYYNEHCDELIANYEADRKKDLAEQIAQLTKQMERTELEPYKIELSSVARKEIETLKKWIDSSKQNLSQYVVGSELHEKELKKIADYETQLSVLIPTL